jgi:hypothetical protein
MHISILFGNLLSDGMKMIVILSFTTFVHQIQCTFIPDTIIFFETAIPVSCLCWHARMQSHTFKDPFRFYNNVNPKVNRTNYELVLFAAITFNYYSITQKSSHTDQGILSLIAFDKIMSSLLPSIRLLTEGKQG